MWDAILLVLNILIIVTSHGRHGVSTQRQLDCLLNSWFILTTMKASKLWPYMREQRASHVECVSMTWCHHGLIHDDVIKWKHFPRYWPFVRGIHRSPVNSPHKGQWRGALKFSLICAQINRWVKNRKAGDLRRHQTHCDVIVMWNGRHVTRSREAWRLRG